MFNQIFYTFIECNIVTYEPFFYLNGKFLYLSKSIKNDILIKLKIFIVQSYNFLTMNIGMISII